DRVSEDRTGRAHGILCSAVDREDGFVDLAAQTDSAQGGLRLSRVWRQQHFVELAPEETVGPVEVQHGLGDALGEGLLDALASVRLGYARRPNLLEPVPKWDLGTRFRCHQKNGEHRNEAPGSYRPRTP